MFDKRELIRVVKKWLIHNSRLLTESVAKREALLIKKTEYASELEEEIIHLLFKLEEITSVRKSEEGIVVCFK